MHLLARSLHLVCLMVYKKSQNEIFIGSALFTGNSRHLIFDCFWAVTNRKMAQSRSKIKNCKLILNINGFLCQKVVFLLKKEGKPAILQLCPILTRSIWTNLPLVCHYFSRYFFICVMWCTRSYKGRF